MEFNSKSNEKLIESNQTPLNFRFEQNHQNSFEEFTQIRFYLPFQSEVKVTIFNHFGEIKDEVVNEILRPGEHIFIWTTSNCSPGKYFCELVAGSFRLVKEMVLID